MTDEQYEAALTKNYELGLLSQLENVGEEFHSRAGHCYASDQMEQAGFFKKLGKEFTDRGARARSEWKEKYKTK